MPEQPQEPSASTPFLLWLNILEIWFGALFYGLYIILFARAVQILLNRIRQLERQGILLGAMVALFSLSTAQLFVLTLKAAVVVGETRMPLDSVETASLLIYVTSCLCSDALLIYRCYVIWNDNPAIVAAPLACLLPPLIISLTTAVFVTLLTGVLFSFFRSAATSIFNPTSLLAVSKVAWAAYERRAMLTSATRRNYFSAGSAMSVGFTFILYPFHDCLHVVWAAVWNRASSTRSSCPSTSTVFSRGASAAPVIFAVVGQIVGIAPTLIIVRSGLPGLAGSTYVKTGASASLSAMSGGV
ncbi:hypothetical protein B0H14DRAFT_3429224 [Mycena olivaceomarginata]|nr:hypothetical protein B0H14DRAFT_3429224 [Mycena olivaceomarginata]